MQKFKRFKELLWILVLLVLAIIVIWFFAEMIYRVDNPNFTSNEVTEGEISDEVGVTYYAGNLLELGENTIRIGDVTAGEVSVFLRDTTQYQIRNPKTGQYEDYSQEYILPGTQVYIELEEVEGLRYVKRVMSETTTVLAGRVIDVSGDVVVIEDYAGEKYSILVGQSTQIYKTGGEEELSVDDILIDKDIVVNSARVYEPGVDLEAGWIEVVDEGEYIDQ